MGHYSNTCLENKPEEAAKHNPFQKGLVNYLNVEEVMNGPDAVMGMFPLNSFTTFVLLIPEHLIHSYQVHLQPSMNFPPKP
jgi:hypothetical protein